MACNVYCSIGHEKTRYEAIFTCFKHIGLNKLFIEHIIYQEKFYTKELIIKRRCIFKLIQKSEKVI